MLQDHEWPQGYHKDNDFRCDGPEASPGNIRVICELMDSLKLKIDELNTRINELEKTKPSRY